MSLVAALSLPFLRLFCLCSRAHRLLFLNAVLLGCLGLSGVTYAMSGQDSLSYTDSDKQALATQIETFLRELSRPYQGDSHISIAPAQLERLAHCSQAELFLPRNGQLRPKVSVGIRCLEPKQWTGYIQASIRIHGTYYIAGRTIAAGTVLTTDDLQPRQGNLLRLLPNGAQQIKELIGFISNQRIAQGAIIKTSALRNPDSIERGQKVRLEARGTGFVAINEGTAMQSGNPGAQIPVRTTAGQIVTGSVLNAHTVLVLM